MAADIGFIRGQVVNDLERLWPYRAAFDGATASKAFDRLFTAVASHSVAIVAEVGGTIVSFVVLEPLPSDGGAPIVYFARTVTNFRRMGICRALLAGQPRPLRYAQDSALAAVVARHLGAVFDPFGYTLAAKDRSDANAA